jgi:hypothetical protein
MGVCVITSGRSNQGWGLKLPEIRVEVGLALLSCKRRWWSELHQNNGVEVHTLADGPIGKGVDRGNHCEEEDDSFGENYDGWVRDRGVAPGHKSERSRSGKRLSCTAAEEVKGHMANL